VFRFEDELRRAARGLAVGEIPSDALARMAILDRLLEKWSARLDLVGFQTPEERVRRYFIEPLAALPWLPDRVVEALDIGSGGGTPALPLAIWIPGSRWTLLEPRRKKSIFLDEAVKALGLASVRVSTERFEASQSATTRDLVTTRGVRLGEPQLDRIFAELRAGGRFLWFSGETRLLESAVLLRKRSGVDVLGPVRLLGSASRSSLLVVEKSGEGRPSGVFHVKQ
jgi:16S rRNA (guanine527-N7)-methyltransferase